MPNYLACAKQFCVFAQYALQWTRDQKDEVALCHLSRSADRFAPPIRNIYPEALTILCRHRWPGNLRACGGNVSRTAELLAIRRQSLQYRLHKYNIVL